MNKKKYDMVVRPCDGRLSSICRKTYGKIIVLCLLVVTYWRDLTNKREGLRVNVKRKIMCITLSFFFLN